MTRRLMTFEIDSQAYTIETPKRGRHFLRNSANDNPAYKIKGNIDTLLSSSAITPASAGGDRLSTKGYIAADLSQKTADEVLSQFFIDLINDLNDKGTIQQLANNLEQSLFREKDFIIQTIFTDLTDEKKRAF
jgi:hypothetical protein